MKITVYEYLGSYSLQPMDQEKLTYDVKEHTLSLPDGCTFETIADGPYAGHEYVVFPNGVRKNIDLDLILENEVAYFTA